MRMVPSIKVRLLNERLYEGNKEYIGIYKIGQRHPIPFRLIQDRNTNEMYFEPQVQGPIGVQLEFIKEEILKQSTII